MTKWSQKQTTLTMRVAELQRENERLHEALRLECELNATPIGIIKNRARTEERAAIVAWLRSENGRCDCFAYDDNECACGGRDGYKTWPLEQTADAIEAGEHLK